MADLNFSSSLPDTESFISVPGIDSEVTIVRDKYGIPHIRAKNNNDAFFGQGFATAQDRLWHMDFDRRQAYGRWSEFVGIGGVESDKMMRRFQIKSSAELDYEALNVETREMLEAYSSGVNAFIQSTKSFPIEYTLVSGAPEPWTPIDCIAVYKVRHIMMGVFEGKLWRAHLANELGADIASDLLRGYQEGHFVIVPPLNKYSGPAAAGFDHFKNNLESIEWLKESPDSGSNSWALHGSKTYSGKPLLSGDPHRGLDTPNCYYQNHVTSESIDVIGLSFPGVPGFPHFGHNQNVAWCVTHAGADYQDIFVENFEFSDPTKYRWKGSLVDAEIRKEIIKVAGQDSESIDVRVTKHGPIFLENEDLTKGLAFSYTSTFGPNLGFQSLIPQMVAASINDADEAMRDWVDPCNNYVFVDVYGDIRYLNRGKVPIRSMDNAWLPVPGWDGDHEWSGYIPFDELPRSTNPENGFIVTANNRIVDEDYPYYIALEYAPEYRSRRIIERVLGLRKATVEDMVAIHSERTSIPALVYMDILKEVVPSGSVEESAKKILIEWNGVMDSDSTAATIYSAFRLKLHDRVFQNLFGSLAGEALIAGGRGAPRHVSQLASNLVTDADFRNESLLPEGETWESIVPKAFGDGILWLIDILGEDVSSWEWGRVHHTNPVHPLSEYHPDLSKKLDPPSVAMGGDGDTPQAGSFAHTNPFVMTGMSVARYVFDASNWDNSRWIVPLGSSGHPGSPHYADQLDIWSKVETIHMCYTETAVDETSVSRQLLSPI